MENALLNCLNDLFLVLYNLRLNMYLEKAIRTKGYAVRFRMFEAQEQRTVLAIEAILQQFPQRSIFRSRMRERIEFLDTLFRREETKASYRIIHSVRGKLAMPFPEADARTNLRAKKYTRLPPKKFKDE